MALITTLAVIGGVIVVLQSDHTRSGNHMVAYFDNTNGTFVGDEVQILGVRVGQIDAIEPQPDRVKVSFSVDRKYKVPADARAVILSPQLITARSIQLTPAYTGGAKMPDGAVIPLNRTAVPVEWDDLRQQLEKLTAALEPSRPGQPSALGAVINTAADNLRDQGASIRDTIIKTSQALSALGDHSDDLFGTIKNLSLVVSALQDSSGLMRQLNVNLAAVTALLSDDPHMVGQSLDDLNTVVADASSFIADNRQAIGISTDKLGSITKAVVDSMDDIKQTLHVAPNAFQNFLNIYQPTQGATSGALALNNFSNPISFICGAIQAASRLGAEQSSKLCVQYLAPIVKNRQWNWLPIGNNLLVGESARSNEITYSEDWMRPDHIPPPAPPAAPAPSAAAPGAATAEVPLPADPPTPPEPDKGLLGMMTPPGHG
ncbi:MCE family protein [Mycolicibacterium sp. CH28]|uniref:MCE family protein n=1 Tax=Mycolicibacterium sp. CH28 TaxID=2512237 RepID=UPI001080EC16|nr:MCE family protein [Mycolicibacterium sp. CH28]TGD87918.1 MCE family protein [Mycolicibacterium sp. CH28]